VRWTISHTFLCAAPRAPQPYKLTTPPYRAGFFSGRGSMKFEIECTVIVISIFQRR
jgi:hypothetical protein